MFPNYQRAEVVVPSDTANLPVVDGGFPHARAFYVTAAGTLHITTAGGDNVSIPAVAVGHLFLAAVKVWATGTTASVIALF